MTTITLGIDISKSKFDVFYTIDKKVYHKVFANNIQGFEALLEHLPKEVAYIAAIEATGSYGMRLVDYLYSKGFKMFVLNPMQIKAYAKSKMYRTKTDKIDSKIIHDFVLSNISELNEWHPRNFNILELRALFRSCEDIKGDIKRYNCRIESCNSPIEHVNQKQIRVYQQILEVLNNKVKALEESMLLLIKNDIELNKVYNLMLSIPGVGPKLATCLIAELPDLQYFDNVKQLVSFLGLNPRIKESGSSVRGRGSISYTGSRLIRKMLYMPAMSAMRFNPIIKEFAKRLVDHGKNGKVIVIACMRKLTHIIYGVLKKNQEFCHNL